MQRGSADIWKENLLEDLELEKVEFRSVREFLLELKKKFSRENEELVKVAELKRIEQGRKTMEKFVQRFRRTMRDSKYKRRILVKEFKREINKVIRRKLIEVERPLTSIKQQYKYATNLDKH